jgi:Domain of unknown function (DUF4440)
MKLRLMVGLLSLIVIFAGCTVWREHEITDFKAATGGEALEHSFWKQVKTKKWNTLEAHLAGNYVFVTPGEGRLDRSGAIARLRQIQLDEYTLGDLQTELNTETLVVTYTITMRGTIGGKPLPTDPMRMMTVWQKQKAGWMELAHSVLGPQNQGSAITSP